MGESHTAEPECRDIEVAEVGALHRVKGVRHGTYGTSRGSGIGHSDEYGCWLGRLRVEGTRCVSGS